MSGPSSAARWMQQMKSLSNGVNQLVGSSNMLFHRQVWTQKERGHSCGQMDVELAISHVFSPDCCNFWARRRTCVKHVPLLVFIEGFHRYLLEAVPSLLTQGVWDGRKERQSLGKPLFWFANERDLAKGPVEVVAKPVTPAVKLASGSATGKHICTRSELHKRCHPERNDCARYVPGTPDSRQPVMVGLWWSWS